MEYSISSNPMLSGSISWAGAPNISCIIQHPNFDSTRDSAIEYKDPWKPSPRRSWVLLCIGMLIRANIGNNMLLAWYVLINWLFSGGISWFLYCSLSSAGPIEARIFLISFVAWLLSLRMLIPESVTCMASSAMLYKFGITVCFDTVFNTFSYCTSRKL